MIDHPPLMCKFVVLRGCAFTVARGHSYFGNGAARALLETLSTLRGSEWIKPVIYVAADIRVIIVSRSKVELVVSFHQLVSLCGFDNECN